MLAKRLFRVFGSSLVSFNRLRWLVWMLTLTSTIGSAAAQEYRTDPVDNKSRAYGANARNWLNNPGAYAADKAHFDEYFDKYYFPEMTRAVDTDLGHLGDLRFNLFKRLLWATSNAQLQQDLTETTFKKMKEFVTSKDPATGATYNPPYHPAVRYNAVLVIGMLDKQYAIEAAVGRRPPQPLPTANAFLTTIVSLAADDKPVPPPLVLGALVGLERHAQFREGLPAEAIAPMTAALLKLVAHEQPIQELDREAYAWMRVRAAGVLARLGSFGENNSVHNALIKLIASSKSLDDRCEVAGLLEKINYKDAKLDDAGTAEPLFALARDVGAAEDKRAQEFQSRYNGAGGARPFPRGGPEGGGPTGAPGEQETYPRRQVLARLTGLRIALAKVKPALPADTQKKVDALLKAIDPAKKAAENKETIELKLAEAIRAMAVAINKAVPPAEKPAAEKEKAVGTAEKAPAAAAKP